VSKKTGGEQSEREPIRRGSRRGTTGAREARTDRADEGEEKQQAFDGANEEPVIERSRGGGRGHVIHHARVPWGAGETLEEGDRDRSACRSSEWNYEGQRKKGERRAPGRQAVKKATDGAPRDNDRDEVQGPPPAHPRKGPRGDAPLDQRGRAQGRLRHSCVAIFYRPNGPLPDGSTRTSKSVHHEQREKGTIK